MSLLESLPQELYIDNIFPWLPLRDVLSLFCVNRFFAKLGNDEVFWKRRLEEDFNFNPSNARNRGFKFLYSRLNKPRVFVWGETSEGRMGRVVSHKRKHASKQLWPLELQIPGARIVELAAGGWSFSALDANGALWVWGQLESGYGILREGFANNSKQASRPFRLGLPTPIRTISCGRSFSTALDHDGQVWCFNSWGRPFIYKPVAFDQTHPGNKIIQIECGWSFCSALTEAGIAYVWNLGAGTVGAAFEEKDTELDEMQNGNAREELAGNEIDGVIQCYTWTMEGVEPLRLPELPRLPALKTGDSVEPQLVKIAAGDHFIIGLTDCGHVLKLNLGDINNPDAIKELTLLFQQKRRGWEYMPNFCDRTQIKELDEFKAPGGAVLPENMRISHISAHFLTFVAYSTGEHSVVLMGQNDASPTTNPTVTPTLQNRGVISIVLGDYHFGALLENGKLLTWGSPSGTGLGDPYEIEPGQPGGFRTLQDRERAHSIETVPAISNPTEVKFDHGLKHPRERFAFSVAASGWHTGAIVVDLEEGESEEMESIEKHEPEREQRPLLPAPSQRAPVPGASPPFIFRGGLRGGVPPRFGLPVANIVRGHHPPSQPPQNDS